jgi:hypothetical protein
MGPPRIEEGDPSHGVAPDSALSQETAYRPVYRCDSRDASSGHLRLVHDAELGKKLLCAARDDVRSNPSRLPLWAFRLYQHQRLGRLGYRAVWSALYAAGRENGSDKWARGCLLHAIGQANASTKAPPSMQTLLRGLI